jgi:Na+-transporting methylmalonyl-CoA/oxaloacetate decarboxylase beta subunit
MSRTWVGVIAFAAGLGAGLLIAKVYAQQTITSDVNGVLGKVGLGGGVVQSTVDGLVPTLVG